MPYASDKQRNYMHAQHPEIAKRWDEEMRTTPGTADPKDPDRQIPENTGGRKFTPQSVRSKMPPPGRGTPKPVGNSVRQKILKKKLGGLTPHQHHLNHVAHQANVKNNPKKYK